MAAAAHHVVEHVGFPVAVRDHDVDGAIVVDIPESSSAAYFGNGKGWPRNSGYLAKLLSVALVVEQLIDLVERIRTPPQRFNAVYSAIGDEQIQMTVIVVVKPNRAGRPALRGSRPNSTEAS